MKPFALQFIQTISLHMLEDAITCVTLHVMLKQTNSLSLARVTSKQKAQQQGNASGLFVTLFARLPQTSVHCVCKLSQSSLHFFFVLLSSKNFSQLPLSWHHHTFQQLQTSMLCPFVPPPSRRGLKPKTLLQYKTFPASTASLSGPLPTR